VSGRRRRSDAGAFRLDPVIIDVLRRVCSGTERPAMADLVTEVGELCAAVCMTPPARQSIYRFMGRYPVNSYDPGELPGHVRQTLYNVALTSAVSGSTVAFYAFNHGGFLAAQYAAAMPWHDLYQAHRRSGWRPRRRALLQAAMECRGI
jgi:hypothetical protein